MPHSIDHILLNPYRHMNAEQRETNLSRLSADISYEDKEFVRRIFPAKGLFNRLTQIFFHSLVEELKAKNITTYTPENADEFARIINRRCTFTGGCAASPTVGQTDARNDPGGIAGESDAAKGDY